MTRKIKLDGLPKNSQKESLIAKMSLLEFSRTAGVNPPDVTNYFDKSWHLSKGAKHKIEKALVELGLLPIPKPKLTCTCPNCGAKHRMVTPFKFKKSYKESTT